MASIALSASTPSFITDAQETMDASACLHAKLNEFNARRLLPSTVGDSWKTDLKSDYEMHLLEGAFVEDERIRVQELVKAVPEQATTFISWFERLREEGPGQHDALFPWLANVATLPEMRWFLTQEAAGEAGFDDLVALTQVRFPVQAKLEMARNYWDEMGRGHERGMHGLLLHAVVRELDLRPTPASTVWESLALSNLMIAFASNRRYAYHAIGALGAIEMTAPGRVAHVNNGLKRLGVSPAARAYFQLHAGLDVKHSQAWNEEVILPLVRSQPELARPIAEGAIMRLASGARCFERYRSHFAVKNDLPPLKMWVNAA